MAHEIMVLPLDPVPETVTNAICRVVQARFSASCSVGPPLAVPDSAYDPARKQYRSDVLLGYLRLMAPLGPDRVLGVVPWDMYTANLNFVFGHAAKGGREALISTARLRPEFYGDPPNDDLFLERVQKESVHELGHTYGLDHCSDPHCVMSFSNSLRDVDAKSSEFCSRCRRRLGPLRPSEYR